MASSAAASATAMPGPPLSTRSNNVNDRAVISGLRKSNGCARQAAKHHSAARQLDRNSTATQGEIAACSTTNA